MFSRCSGKHCNYSTKRLSRFTQTRYKTNELLGFRLYFSRVKLTHVAFARIDSGRYSDVVHLQHLTIAACSVLLVPKAITDNLFSVYWFCLSNFFTYLSELTSIKRLKILNLQQSE